MSDRQIPDSLVPSDNLSTEIKLSDSLVDLAGRVTLTATSLTLPPNTTLERWIDVGEALTRVERAAQWWIADWWNSGERYGDRVAIAAGRDFPVDVATARNYASIAKNVSLRNETLSFTHHGLVAPLDPAEQVKWLRRAEQGDGENPWTIVELRKALLRAKLESRHSAIGDRVKAEPKKRRKYALIYADPPWKFVGLSELGTAHTSPDQHYPTMDSVDIGALKVWSRSVTDLAAPDAGLFLWCTSANIEQALGVVRAWGFKYKTHAVWDKQHIGTGYIFRNQHEPLIYASRGNFPMPLEKFSSVFSYPRGEHSAKPVEIRQALESMYPRFTENDRIELFARGDIPGWTTWGNEAS